MVVGITDSGDSVLYDVVDMTPTAFDIKEAESSTGVTTQNAIDTIHEDSAESSISQDADFVKHKFSDKNLNQDRNTEDTSRLYSDEEAYSLSIRHRQHLT